MRRRVFIAHHKGDQDYSKLADIGPLVPVFIRSIYPDDTVGTSPRYRALTVEALQRLSSFDPAHDVLAMTGGDPFALAVCAAYLGARCPHGFTIAKFDARDDGFYLVQIGGPYEEATHQGPQAQEGGRPPRPAAG